MRTADLRNKLYLHRAKVVFLLLVLLSGSAKSQGYFWARKNNPFYDEKRKITYGFLIGLHTSSYQINYSDLFVTPAMDTVVAVNPKWKPGFSLGFIVNYRAHEFLDFRITPKVAFYENSLTYLYSSDQTSEQLVETTMVEVPVLVKYKSMRRGNIRMYMIGGLKPGIEASGNKDVANVTNSLEVTNFNLNLEAGLGFDLYFPLFKFSPEIRFSRGIIDILENPQSDPGKSLSRINTNTVTVYLIFQ
jgi:hypothetical protein